jgi:hypothetical protein
MIWRGASLCIFGNPSLTKFRTMSRVQRRQYALVNRAREFGWEDVDVIDDDVAHPAPSSCDVVEIRALMVGSDRS